MIIWQQPHKLTKFCPDAYMSSVISYKLKFLNFYKWAKIYMLVTVANYVAHGVMHTVATFIITCYEIIICNSWCRHASAAFIIVHGREVYGFKNLPPYIHMYVCT